MKLKDYIKDLNELIELQPEALEMDVITAKDDEGNGFSMVNFTPETGYFEEDEFRTDVCKHNVVCLN